MTFNRRLKSVGVGIDTTETEIRLKELESMSFNVGISATPATAEAKTKQRQDKMKTQQYAGFQHEETTPREDKPQRMDLSLELRGAADQTGKEMATFASMSHPNDRRSAEIKAQ